ncbi:MAG: ornithine carbamoyltransferase [Thermodesulfobacteriota bacterium]
MNKDILTLSALNRSDFDALFARAAELKDRRQKGVTDRSLVGKTVGMIFEKPSTRTRISFEAAAAQLGATPIFMQAADTQLARNEPIADTARVLERYLDALVLRTFSQQMQEEFADIASIPIINALTDRYHPCQVLSDLMTVIECKGGYEGVKVAWIGDGNNMAQSWINAAAVLGFQLTLACPETYMPDASILAAAQDIAGGKIAVTNDAYAAVRNVDVVNTDVWASMGQEAETEARRQVFAPFQVNEKLLSVAAEDAIVMHCLPAHRGEEITADVLEGSQAVVWDQTENKLHMHKAILEMLIVG